MAKGDHIYVRRRLGYTHHGIDCGDGTVIHFTGEPGKKAAAAVARTSMTEFALNSQVRTRRYRERDSPEIAVERAESQLGTVDYNLLINNCEHFATWCCTGRNGSQQVEGAAAAAGAAYNAGVVGVLAAPVAVVMGIAGMGAGAYGAYRIARAVPNRKQRG